MTQIDTTNLNNPLEYAPIPLRTRLMSKTRVILTLGDQGLVSIANFATNFLLLHTFSNNSKDVAHYAYYTLAFNLMVWAGEFQATLVFTPHTILTPRLPAGVLKRFHGSTLIHNTAVCALTAIATLIAALVTRAHDPEMSAVLLALGLGTMAIGLRNYARPYAFAAKEPGAAVILDLAVAALQIGGILALKHFGKLEAWSAVVVVAAASGFPAVVWLMMSKKQFEPNLRHSLQDIRDEWPNTRWVFLSGLVWNAGMLLYPWLIKSTSGNNEVAIWGACYQLACVANPLLMGLQNFIGPRVAEAYTEMKRAVFRRYVYKTACYTALLMAGPALFLSIYADSALKWLTKGQFTGHETIIAVLCIAFVSQAITFTLSRGLFAIHRADIDLYCNFLPLATLFSVGIWATHTYGATGAAVSMLIAQLFSSGSRAIIFYIAARNPREPAIVLNASGGSLKGAV